MSHLKKIAVFATAAFLLNISANAQPVISGFSPSSGPIGTTVTISGNNFSSTPANNLVRFGYVQATVSAASPTSLTVRVPRGATFLPITVQVNGLLGSSAKPFNVLSPGCNSSLGFTSFDTAKHFASGSGSWMMGVGDLDGDGRTDIAYGNYGTAANATVHRNISTVGDINFEPGVNYLSGAYPDDAVISDFDGDGKPDFVVVNAGDFANNLSIFRNTSSPGAITFATRVGLESGTFGDKLTVGDLDKDGKPDLVLSFTGSGNISILRNTSTPGTVSFAPLVAVPSGYDGFVAIADIDGDGLSDVALSNWTDNTVSVLRNTSTVGVISFAPKMVLPAGTRPLGIALADMDADGKNDIVFVHFQDTKVSLFKNNSTPGNLAFASRADFSTAPSFSYNMSIDNLDGDSKPDIAFCSNNGIWVLNNTSTTGTFSFSPVLKYTSGYGTYNCHTSDLDNDGKADLIGGVKTGAQPVFSVFRNQVCESVAVCPSGGGSISSSILGDTYQWQLDNGGGFANLSDNTNYTGTTSNQLQLLNMPISWNGYKYRCLVDGQPTSTTVLKFVNTWLGTVSNQWEDPANWNCSAVPNEDTDVMIPAGSVLLNSNTTVRSITVSPGASLTVAAGFSLIVIH